MNEPKSFDIVIAGGGLIGPALALALAHHGLDVAIADPLGAQIRKSPDFDPRAYTVALGSKNVLDALGIWARIADQAQRISNISVQDATPGMIQPASLHFDPAELDEAEIGWVISDHVLRQALLEAMNANPAITQFDGTGVTRITPGPGASQIRLSNGQALGASLVVACDGRRSGLAHDAGIRRIGWSYDQTGQVTCIAHTLPHEGHAHQKFFPGGPFAILPMHGGYRSCLVWSETKTQAAYFDTLDDRAFLGEIRTRIGGRLGEITQIGPRAGYPLDLSLACDYVRPRLALVGDAAHGVHPIAGQGMNMGLRDVAALGEVLIDARRLGEDCGSLNVLKRYERWRRFDATVMALGMDGLNRLFSNRNTAFHALRNLGLSVVAKLPPARRFFLREAVGLSGRVPQLMHGRHP